MDLDVAALGKYAGAITLQTGIMSGALWGLQQASSALAASESLPGGVEGADAAKWLVTAFFLVTSIKSRIFSPLDASRPTLKGEKKAMSDRKRPSWMPPPVTFPIVWSTIGLLRGISSVMVWEACGRDATALPLVVFCLHLAVGDCWNHINNVERRAGVAVPGVLCCLASCVAAVAAYYNTDTTAGLVLAPSAVWISIASLLIYSIWDLNGRDPLYPTKGESELIEQRSSA